jgi:3-oxoacyl-[acyl-carrier protein] reductase
VLNVLVTGGTRGLGLAIARKLASVGYRVLAVARRESEELASAAREAECERHGALHFIPFDLHDLADIADLVKDVRRDFGPIYGLVNNAAIGTSGVLATMRDADIEQAISLNILSPITLTKYVVRAMMNEGSGGRIVNVTSIVGFTGYSGLSVYGSTKASMLGFTRSLAREVGPLGITVNAVAPGFLDTEMTRDIGAGHREQIARRSALRRLAEPDDIACAVEFLLDAKSRNMTGSVLTVDAGSTA